MHSQPLHQVYASYMRNHPYGTAVYSPLPYRDFHPGSVGYFDANGDWNHITDLSNPATLAADQYTAPPEPLHLAPPDTHIEWGPKASRNIHARHTSLKAGIDPALATVLPADLSAHFTYSNSTAGGALLLTTPPITRQRYYHETPFKRWVQDNAASLVHRREEIATYGLWVVCSTHATRDCAIHLWDEKSRKVDVGFDVGVDGVGELGPAGGWVLGQAEGGWERYLSDDSAGDQGRVVFFGGLFFRPRRVPIGQYLKPLPKTVEYSSSVTTQSAELAIEAEPETETVIEVVKPDTEGATPVDVEETMPTTETETIVDVVLPDEGIALRMECEPWRDDI